MASNASDPTATTSWRATAGKHSYTRLYNQIVSCRAPLIIHNNINNELQVAAPYVRAKLQAIYLEHRATRPVPSLPTWRDRLVAAAVAAYPSVHAATHALLVAYQLGYLLQATDCYSPGLAVVQQRVRRMTAQDTAAKQRRADGNGLVARGVRLLADNTRNAVIAAVFLYKVYVLSCRVPLRRHTASSS